MKKCFLLSLITLLLLSSGICYADEFEDFYKIDEERNSQKSITNKEFEQVMDALQAKTKKKEERKQKRKIKKISGGGQSLHSELNPDKDITELGTIKPEPEELLINLPVRILVDGKILDKGYYNVVARQDENKEIYLDLYQAHFLMASIKATETDDDFGKETVDFVDINEYKNSFLKIIFGSIDFNAYAYVYYMEE